MFNTANGIIGAFFQGLREARKDTEIERKFRDLNKTMDCWIGTASTRLLEVDELDYLVDHARDDDDYNSILDHMYRFNATEAELGYFKEIEKKIIHKMWPK